MAACRDLYGQRLAARRDGPHGLLAKVPPSECRKRTFTLYSTAETVTNKIRFAFARVALKLLYFDGFEVARTDAMLCVLCRADYAKMKIGILHKARMQWNKLDQSDAPHFSGSDFSDVATACSHDCGLQPASNEGMS